MRKKNIIRQIGVVTALILFSLISWGATKSLAQDVTLAVGSAYGSPSPPVTPPIHSYLSGTSITCSVNSPVPGEAGIQYVCIGYSGTVSCPSGAGTSVTFDITANSTIVWNWETQYKLTTNANPADGGTVAPSGVTWHYADVPVDVTATANVGYGFAGWSGDIGFATPTNNPISITMDSAKAVTANFTKIGVSSGSLTISGQGILPMSGPTGVLYFDITNSAATAISGVLNSVKVEFEDIGSDGCFTNTDLAEFGDSTSSGLSLYQDDGDGIFDEGPGGRIPDVIFSGWSEVTITANYAITVPKSSSIRFYIIVRTSDMIEGENVYQQADDFKVTLKEVKACNLAFPLDTATDTITCEARVVDLVPWRSDANSITKASNHYFPGNETFDSARYGYIPEIEVDPEDRYPWAWEQRQLLPSYTPTAVLGIDCAAVQKYGSDLEYLDSVTVTFTDTSTANFNPEDDLVPLHDSTHSGVTLWRDDDGDGIFDASKDAYLGYGAGWLKISDDKWKITVSPKSPEAIDPTVDNLVDYFIVICSEPSGQSTERSIAYGADFKAWIENDDIEFRAAKPDYGLWRSKEIGGEDAPPNPNSVQKGVKEIKANFELHKYTYSSERIDATSSPIPIFGLNLCDGASKEDVLKKIKVTFLDKDGFAPSDLADLSDDESSGISLWKDNKSKGNRGTFDPEGSPDTLVPLSTEDLEWTTEDSNHFVYLKPKTQIQLYNDDTYTDSNKGDDYFICIRTSSDKHYNGTRGIDYKDKIKVEIGDGDVAFGSQSSALGSALSSDEIESNVPTFLSNLVSVDQAIVANSAATAIMGINLIRPDDDTKKVYLTSLVVQIIDNGKKNFNITDLAELSEDPETSGIAIYKDDGAENCAFDDSDSGLILMAKPAEIGNPDESFLRIQLVLNTPQEIPINDVGDNEGNDYFIVIRTSEGIEKGDDFSFRLWGSEVQRIKSKALGFSSVDTVSPEGSVTLVTASNTITVSGLDTTDYTDWTLVFTSGLAKERAYCIDNYDADKGEITSNGINFAGEGVEINDTFKIYKADNRTYERLETNTLTCPSVTTTVLTDEVKVNQKIDATSKPIPMIGINVYDEEGTATLNGLRVYLNPLLNFDPEIDLATLSTDINSGVLVYKDAGNGEFSSTSDYLLPIKSTEWKSDITENCIDTDGTTSEGKGDSTDSVVPGDILKLFDDADLVCWYDADSSRDWTTGDGLWMDNNDNNIYDEGEKIIIKGALAKDKKGILLDGNRGFGYNDIDDDNFYDSGEDIYFLGRGRTTLGKYLDLTLGSPDTLPSSDSGDSSGDDYFVAIRTSANIEYGDKFSASLPSNCVIYSSGKSFANTNLTTNYLIANIPVSVSDLVNSGNTISKNEKKAVIGINFSDSGNGTNYLIKLKVLFGGSGFGIEDIATLSTDADGGVAIYKDTNGNGAYDEGIDEIVPLTSAPYWEGNSVVLIIPEGNASVPDTDDNFGNDYFIVIRSSSAIREGDQIQVGISDITFNTGSSGESLFSSESNYISCVTSSLTEPQENTLLDGCLDTFVIGTSGESLPLGTKLTSFKIADLVYWVDSDSSNDWTDGDALWIDKNYDGRYDSGDSLIIGSPAQNTIGTILTDNYHFVYYDKDKDSRYDYGEDIYYEGGDGNHYNYYSSKYIISYTFAETDSSAVINLYADSNQDSSSFDVTIATGLTKEQGEQTYEWDVSSLPSYTKGTYYICLNIFGGANEVYRYSLNTITINHYPYIKISTPSTDTWTWADTYAISWIDSDPDDNALISLYYDRDAIWDNGNETLIDTTTEDSTTDFYNWNISSIPNGGYYLVAKIDDGTNEPYYSYSKGKLTVTETPSVTLEAVGSYAGVSLNWIDNTPDVDDKTIEIYRRDLRNGVWSGEIPIADIPVSPSKTSYSYLDTSLDLGVIGGYFLQITCPSIDIYLSNSVEVQRLAFSDEETPDGLKIVPGANVITLQWTDNSDDEDSFEVERKLATEEIDKYVVITTVPANSTSYDDYDVIADVTYSYRVRARKYYPETGNYGYSKYTGEVTGSCYTFNHAIGSPGGGGCFIATAAYGTPMAKEVRSLCEFRDDVLLKYPAGRNFVEFYYKTSPPIADFIRNRPDLKAMVREALKPLVRWSRFLLSQE